MLMDSLPNRLNLLIGERSSSVIYSDILDSEINPKNIVRFKRCFFWHVASSVQEELTIKIYQVYLSLHSTCASGEVSTNRKVEQLSSFQSRDTDLRVRQVQSLERQDAGVVCNTPMLLELGLYLLVQLKCFASFGDGTDAKLCRQAVFLTDGMVDQSLYRVLACRLLSKAGFGNLVTGGVERFHCGEQPL